MSQAIDYLQHLIYPFKSEADLLKAIEELSLKFTQERERIGDYLKDPRLVAAYTAFYLTTNIPKWEGVMNWMPTEWRELVKKCDLVDLGAGPGTFSLAYKKWGGEGDVYQVEISELMREQAAKLWGLASQGSNLYQGYKWSWKTEREKILLFGHSANEMGVAAAIDYIEQINPDHILFIEPGTKDFFPKMLEIRKYLLDQKFNLLFPCPDKLECPLKGTNDWCHQFLKVTHESSIERLSQMAKKDRRMLPLTVQAFSRSHQIINAPVRVVRVLSETKFSFEWEVCEGKKVVPYQVMKRGMDKGEQKEVSQVLAGTAVEVEVEKELAASKRVRLIKINY